MNEFKIIDGRLKNVLTGDVPTTVATVEEMITAFEEAGYAVVKLPEQEPPPEQGVSVPRWRSAKFSIWEVTAHRRSRRPVSLTRQGVGHSLSEDLAEHIAVMLLASVQLVRRYQAEQATESATTNAQEES